MMIARVENTKKKLSEFITRKPDIITLRNGQGKTAAFSDLL